MRISSVNNASFTAQFRTQENLNKEGLRRMYDNNIEQIEKAKYNSLKAYDIMTKDPEIIQKVDSFPNDTLFYLEPSKMTENENGELQVSPVKLWHLVPDTIGSLRKASHIELDKDSKGEIKDTINNWLNEKPNFDTEA